MLHAACIHAAAAQGVFGSVFPSPASWFDESIQFREAKAFAEDLKQLPGQRVTRVSKLQGKWLHRQLRRNVELDQVRVPQLFTSMLLEAAAIDVTRTGKAGEQKQNIDNERRAYIVRLDKSYLNIAGACAPYQPEDLCQRYRSVWFSLPQLAAAQVPQSQLPSMPGPLPRR
jgi:hypothetical protein